VSTNFRFEKELTKYENRDLKNYFQFQRVTKMILQVTRKGKRKRLEKHEETLFKRIDVKLKILEENRCAKIERNAI
jgi:hypothetical protein